MNENVFAVQPYPPKIIIWDDWPTSNFISPSFSYVIGIVPKKATPEPNICSIMIRPEFRLFNEKRQGIFSSICEMPFIVTIKEGHSINKHLIFGVIETFVDPWYSQEFLSRTKKNISLYFDLQRDKDSILEVIQQNILDSGW